MNRMANVKNPSATAERLRAHFAETLRRVRVSAGITQTELASATECSQSWISALERGDRVPDLDQVALLADALGVHPSELLSE